MKIFNH